MAVEKANILTLTFDLLSGVALPAVERDTRDINLSPQLWPFGSNDSIYL